MPELPSNGLEDSSECGLARPVVHRWSALAITAANMSQHANLTSVLTSELTFSDLLKLPVAFNYSQLRMDRD